MARNARAVFNPWLAHDVLKGSSYYENFPTSLVNVNNEVYLVAHDFHQHFEWPSHFSRRLPNKHGLFGGEGTLSQAIIISRTHPARPCWLATLWKGLGGL